MESPAIIARVLSDTHAQGAMALERHDSTKLRPGKTFQARQEETMAEATQKQLDDAHAMGVRDGKAGGKRNPANPPSSVFGQGLHRRTQIVEAYNHGYDAAKSSSGK
jgi:hypothetical protein